MLGRGLEQRSPIRAMLAAAALSTVIAENPAFAQNTSRFKWEEPTFDAGATLQLAPRFKDGTKPTSPVGVWSMWGGEDPANEKISARCLVVARQVDGKWEILFVGSGSDFKNRNWQTVNDPKIVAECTQSFLANPPKRDLKEEKELTGALEGIIEGLTKQFEPE